MTDGTPFDAVPPLLRDALLSRGFDSMTTVQQAVLDPALQGRDLRISSQTGSGKTVAIGFVLFPSLDETDAEHQQRKAKDGTACAPRALVITPTRELANQVQKELSWLYADAPLRIAVVIGGTSFGVESRSLRRGADVVVGTPGRLLDHLARATIDPRGVGVVVLDEADQMLDLGFREELENILEKLPKERRTHLVSATFSREVRDLAARYQHDAAGVEGTRLGVANVDIAHVVHTIVGRQRDDVVINLLLLAPGEATLIFTRTRVDASEMAQRLATEGFSAAALTGEMEQRDRTRTVDAFRDGSLQVLVATDVAARGLDLPEVSRVIHADPPNDPDAYTHRSGRTGRAGRKGTSIMLVPPAGREHAMRLLRRARVEATFEPAPSGAMVAKAIEARLVAQLGAPGEGEDEPRVQKLADALLAAHPPRTVVVRLLAMLRSRFPTPREVATIDTRPSRDDPRDGRGRRPSGYDRDRERDVRPPVRDTRTYERGPIERGPAERGPTERGPAERGPTERRTFEPSAPAPRAFPRFERPLERPADDRPIPLPEHRPERPRDRTRAAADHGVHVPFRVSWGSEGGADARRLMALVCRRGEIRGHDVGAIEVGTGWSRVEVATDVAEDFAKNARRYDPRDPKILITPWVGDERGGDERARRPGPPPDRADRPRPRPRGGDVTPRRGR